jgi:hypothetical protein
MIYTLFSKLKKNIFFRKIYSIIIYSRRAVSFLLLPLKKIYYYFYLNYYVFKNRVDYKKYILFAHGSISDTFYMASLLDSFSSKYGDCYVIAALENMDIFRVYCKDKRIKFIFETEKKCQVLRNAITISGRYKNKGLLPGIIRPLHGVLYPYLSQLTLNLHLLHRDMFTWILGLDKATPYNYINYTKNEFEIAEKLLLTTGFVPSKIALINPICYTHKNLSIQAWKGIADAFASKGLHPVFNIKSKVGDNNQFTIPKGYSAIEIPAYLVPLCSNIVAISCARQGGAFDLMRCYSNKDNNCILILLSEKVELSINENKDYNLSSAKEGYFNFSGRFLSNIVLLDSIDSESEAHKKLLFTLNNNE